MGLAQPSHGQPLNALTIDVEDYFHVTAFKGRISPDKWDRLPARVFDNTSRSLDLLDEFGVKATFFILGWVAERYPDLVKRIRDSRHEIACHGHGHQLLHDIGPEAFREDVRKARGILEDIGGAQVRGYRAPSYSITAKSLWALDILIEEGFEYDSSIFPVMHDIYGIRDACRFPHVIERPCGRLVEFPLSTVSVKLPGCDLRLPVAGGGYLRLLPAWTLLRALRRINRQEGRPAVLYFHPWEIDPAQPRIRACGKSRLRHYLNLHTTEGKLRLLLDRLPFAPMSSVLLGQARRPSGQLHAPHTLQGTTGLSV